MAITDVEGGDDERCPVAEFSREPEASFNSILFLDDGPPTDDPAEWGSFFTDLNLDQIVEAVTAGRDEYDLAPFFHLPLRNIDAIAYRHEIMRDLDGMTMADSLRSFAQRFREVRQYLTLVGNLSCRPNKQGWFLRAVTAYGEGVSSLTETLCRENIKSRGFLSFGVYLSRYTASDYFTSMMAEAKRIAADLSTVHYSISISGLSVKVTKYESEIYYSADVMQCFAKFRHRATKDYRVKFYDRVDTDHVEGQILEFVARLYPEIFSKLDNFCTMHADFIDPVVRRFGREIQFYLTYLEYITRIKATGLQFCYPRITRYKTAHVRGGFDLALADKRLAEKSPIVCNDFCLKGDERILVVSGPKQGGKTTFARALGQHHYLASLGCPVPGSDAQLFLFDRIFTHFARQEDVTTLQGGLENDLSRIHAILGSATSDSVIILNEIFNSTTLHDTTFLGRKIIEQIIELDALCVCVTFVDELASMSEKTVSMVSTIAPHNPALRTYKIVRKPADGLAYALSIAEKYRLTRAWLLDRIRP